MEAYRHFTAEGLSEFLETTGKLEMDNQRWMIVGFTFLA
jgi:hypothetical protein